MQRINGFTEAGNTTLAITGAAGTIARKVQGSFPSATVTVYRSGTVTLASIYSDNGSPPTAKANPFTAASDGSFFFFAPNGTYDIRFSGGGILTPFTIGGFRLYDVLTLVLDATDVQYSGGILGSDPTAALQAVISAVSSGAGATIQLPPGTIDLTTAMSFTNRRINLIGAGRDATVLRWQSNGIDGLNVVSGCRVAHLTLQGPDSATTSGFSGIDSGSATDVVIEDCIIEKWGSHGINTGGSSSRWLIRGNIVRNNHEDDGILVGGGSSRIIITDNIVYSNGAWGVDINGSNCIVTKNLIYSNGVEQGGTDSGGIAVFGYVDGSTYDASDNLIEGNTVFQNTGEQLWLLSQDAAVANFNRILGNEFSSGTGHGIKVGGSNGTQTGNKFHNNACLSNAARGIFLQIGTGVISQTEITENRSCNNGTYGVVIEAGCIDTQLKHNVLLSNTTAAIFDQGTRTSSAGNKDTTADGTYDITGDVEIGGAMLQTGRHRQVQATSFTNGDTTPSVSAGSVFATANVAGTTITDYDDGASGQLLVVVAADNNTTISPGGNVSMRSIFAMRSGDVIAYYRSGSTWFEIFRSPTRKADPQSSFSNGDTTPSVVSGNVFATANAAPTSITDFDDGIAGQWLFIIAGDANTTIVDGGNLAMAGNFAMGTGDTITFYRSGTTWYEFARSNN